MVFSSSKYKDLPESAPKEEESIFSVEEPDAILDKKDLDEGPCILPDVVDQINAKSTAHVESDLLQKIENKSLEFDPLSPTKLEEINDDKLATDEKEEENEVGVDKKEEIVKDELELNVDKKIDLENASSQKWKKNYVTSKESETLLGIDSDKAPKETEEKAEEPSESSSAWLKPILIGSCLVLIAICVSKAMLKN